MSEYPECDKILEVSEQSNTLSEFVDWLRDQEIYLCKLPENMPDEVDHRDQEYFNNFQLLSETMERLFARFFEIDLDKVEEERKEILRKARESQ